MENPKSPNDESTKYTIETLLGKGMGWFGEYLTILLRTVACKMLHQNKSADLDERENFSLLKDKSAHSYNIIGLFPSTSLMKKMVLQFFTMKEIVGNTLKEYMNVYNHPNRKSIWEHSTEG